jgi:hypothetical protein
MQPHALFSSPRKLRLKRTKRSRTSVGLQAEPKLLRKDGKTFIDNWSYQGSNSLNAANIGSRGALEQILNCPSSAVLEA